MFQASQWLLLLLCQAMNLLDHIASTFTITCCRLYHSCFHLQPLILIVRITPYDFFRLTLDGRKMNSDEQSLISQKRKQTQQHLQRKIQQRQQHKQQQQHQLNLLLHPSTPTGKQFTPILPQTQKVSSSPFNGWIFIR